MKLKSEELKVRKKKNAEGALVKALKKLRYVKEEQAYRAYKKESGCDGFFFILNGKV